jgi:hypothetical protein
VKVVEATDEGDANNENFSSPAKVNADMSNAGPGSNKDEKKEGSQSESGVASELSIGENVMKSKALLQQKLKKEEFADDTNEKGDDINNIAESRTFLAKVSSRNISIHWLELADYEDGPSYENSEGRQQQQMQVPQMMPAMVPMSHFVDPGQGPGFYPSSMGYAAQLHQNALKSRQQYFFQLQQQQMQQSQSQTPAVQSPYGMSQTHWIPGAYPAQSASPSENTAQNAKQHATQHLPHPGSGGEAALEQGGETPYGGQPQHWVYYHPIPVPVPQYGMPQYMGPPGMMSHSHDPDLDEQNNQKKRRKR